MDAFFWMEFYDLEGEVGFHSFFFHKALSLPQIQNSPQKPYLTLLLKFYQILKQILYFVNI